MSKKLGIKALMEKYMPICLFFLVVICGIVLSVFFNFTFPADPYDKILDAIINFSSIIIGFMGVLIGILFSLRDSKVVSLLFKYNKERQLKRYFLESICVGIALLLFSMILYLREQYPIHSMAAYLIDIWCGLLFYSAACHYRIISLMIKIIFIKDEDIVDYDFSNSQAGMDAQNAFTKK